MVATGAMPVAGCAGAGGGGGGNDDHLTPEQIQKIMERMDKVYGCQAPAADATSTESSGAPASKKAKLWHPASVMEGLQLCLNTLLQEQDRERDCNSSCQESAGAGGAATALAGAGGAATALATAQPSMEPAPEPIAKAALHSYPPKGPAPVPVDGSSAAAGSATPNRSIGDAPANVTGVPLAPAAKAAADPAPATIAAAATAADPAATTAATAGTGGAAATTPATGADQLLQWVAEQQQTQQQLEQGPAPILPPPAKPDQPATSSTPTTAATHVDAPIGVHTGVAKAAKSPPPPLSPRVIPPPHTRAPPAPFVPAADGIPSANSFLGAAAIVTGGSAPLEIEAAAVTVAAGTVPPEAEVQPVPAAHAAGDPTGAVASDAAVVAVTQLANNCLPAGAWTGRCVFCFNKLFLCTNEFMRNSSLNVAVWLHELQESNSLPIYTLRAMCPPSMRISSLKVAV